MSKFTERLQRMDEERRKYALKNLPMHLAKAEQQERLQKILTTFDFLQVKLEEFGPQPLLEDYDYIYDDDFKLIQAAIRLSAHILADDPTQLASQLWGRLSKAEKAPAIQTLLKQVQPTFPWLHPLKSSLIAPGGPLLRTINAHSDSINAVAITPDGKYAISTSLDKTLKVWDLENGTELSILKGHSDSVNAVAVTPEGLVVSASSDHTLKLWDLSKGTEQCTFIGHSDKVNAVAVTPDGKHAISASDDNTLKLWDLNTGIESTLSGHSAPINAVVVSPDGSRIVSASSDGSIKVWDLQTRSVLASFNADAKLNSLAVAPDGLTIIAGDELGQVHFLSLENPVNESGKG